MLVEIPSPPARVLPGNAGAVDLVTDLLAPERLAALPSIADTWSSLDRRPGDWSGVPRFAEFTAERLLAHRPDLVVTSPFNEMDTIERVREVGVPVLPLPDTFDLDSVAAALRLLAEVLDVPDRGREIIAELRRREARLLERASKMPEIRAVAYANYGFGGTGAGSRTTQHEVFRLAGLVNLLAERGDVGVVPLEFEDLLALDPDLIVVSHRDDTGVGVTRDVLLAEPSLEHLRAVREDRIVSIPARHIFTVSQEIVTGAAALADEVEAWLERSRSEEASAGDGASPR